jgi:sugar phosphate isomerase/epimerase
MMQVTWSVFPKFHKHLDPHGLAAFVHDIGVDTTNLVVRDGYWVEPKNLAADTAKFTQAMKREGIELRYATTDYTPAQLIKDPTPLQVFHDNGIRAFRMGHVKATADVRGDLKRTRGEFEHLAKLCEKHGVRAIYQLHHETLLPSPSSVFPILDGLPSEAVAMELDPGNQSFEGYEDYERSARLLGKYLGWCACKDSVIRQDPKGIDRPDKGWKRKWTPVYEGVVRWDELFAGLAAIDFKGVIKLMPHYDPKDPDTQQKKLKMEVAYLKNAFAAAQGADDSVTR